MGNFTWYQNNKALAYVGKKKPLFTKKKLNLKWLSIKILEIEMPDIAKLSSSKDAQRRNIILPLNNQ